MSAPQRIGLLTAALAALVIAFIALRSDDEQPSPGPRAGATGAAPATTTAPEAATAPAPAGPDVVTIRVRGGRPVGGVRDIAVAKGDRVRLRVASPDTSDEIHVHGYDLKRDLKAGGEVGFSFDADAEGIFEVELEGSGEQIGRLEVRPR